MPTTTPIAFAVAKAAGEARMFLEKMNILSVQGCGVLCHEPPAVGAVLRVVFRLSTSHDATRCRAEVVGAVPTTPAGWVIHSKRVAKGDAPLAHIPAGGISDSATAIFRMADLAPSPKPPSADPLPRVGIAQGFCLRFVDLDDAGRAAVEHHLRTSRALADRLAAQGGRSAAADRLAIAETFHEGDLSKRALDW